MFTTNVDVSDAEGKLCFINYDSSKMKIANLLSKFKKIVIKIPRKVSGYMMHHNILTIVAPTAAISSTRARTIQKSTVIYKLYINVLYYI